MRACTAVAIALLAALGGAAGPARSSAQPTRLVVGYRAVDAGAVTLAEQSLGLTRIHRIAQLRIDVLSGDAATLAPLQAEAGVRFAYVDSRVHAFRVPNDPFWPGQWGPAKIH